METIKEQMRLETEVQVLTEQVEFLKSIIEWCVEAHGNSETTEYTGNESPWKLKEYVEEQMEEFNKIGVFERMITETIINNDNSTEVLTNKHSDFKRLMYAMDKLMSNGCKHTHDNFHGACNKLEQSKDYKIDRVKTLEWMMQNGGYCDCEILMNAQFAGE